MVQATVRSAAAVDTWTSLVKAALGAFGLALLAGAPLVPRPEAFPYLPHYAYVAGGILVLTAATMRLRSMLIVLGCVALSAALAFTLVGDSTGERNMAALALYGAAGVIFGAIGRRSWMAIPFLLVPLLVVAPHGDSWTDSRAAFSRAWTDALECDCLLAGLPAGMAVVGAAIGELRRKGWPDVRPSAVPLLLLCAGLVMAGLVLGSLLPDSMATVRTMSLRAALLAGILGWVGLAYQVGRLSLVWEAAIACLLLLGGALFLDRATQFPEAIGPTLAITLATSLLPAVLVGVGLLVRAWIGKERPKADAAALAAMRRTAAEESFLVSVRAMHETGESGPPVAPATPPPPPPPSTPPPSPTPPTPPGGPKAP